MKAHNFRRVKGQAYTRTEYISGHPPPKITKFTVGNTKLDFVYRAILIAEENAQLRHNALEAARVATNRVLQERLGENYHLKVLPYPHIVLRENKMIFGAHADRLQDGMRRSFGKPVGTAARVKRNQPIIIVGINEDGVEVAKEALRLGDVKLPIRCRIVVEKKLEPD